MNLPHTMKTCCSGNPPHDETRCVTCDPYTGVQIRVGVMGSASQELDPGIIGLCRELGRSIAKQGCCLLTGACPGIPHEVVLGAKEFGGHVVGISPGVHLKEHVERFSSPYRQYDVLIFTGLGLMGRELINIRSSDIIVIVGGRSGTLGEFAIAYEEGKLIGVLSGSGGIVNVLPEIEQNLGKKTGAEVIYHNDPAQLIGALLARYQGTDYTSPCQPDRCGQVEQTGCVGP